MSLPQRLRSFARALLALSLLSGLGAGCWLGLRALDAPISVVTISGELSLAERGRASELVSTMLPAGVLTLSAADLQRSLEEESWVAHASVRRRWPDGIDVLIEPEVPVARWGDGALLSSRGRVVRPLEDVLGEGLPRLRGPEGSAERVMSTYQRIADVMRALDMKVEALDLDPVAGWRFTVAGDVEIVLGDSDVLDRLRRVETVLRMDLAQRFEKIRRVDARYDNGVAVAWRTPAAPQQLADQLAQRH